MITVASAAAALADDAPVFSRPPDSCGTVQAPPLVAQKPIFAPGVQRVIHLNKNGGMYNLANAPTDSAQNVANARIVSQRGTGMIMIAPLEAGFDYNQVRECVINHYKPYNVRIVETQPKGEHIEAVVGGNGTELGFPSGALFGIASADNFCGVTETGIAFTFSRTHTNVPRKNEELCATIAHEVGHLLALEHEVTPIDLMSYVLIAQSNTKTFVNGNAQCGVDPQSTNPCSCSSGTTNSGARLGQFVGARPAETNPPSLTVKDLKDGGKIPPAFTIVAEASDAEGMADVLVYVDGTEIGHSAQPEGKTYKISGSATEGQHMLSVVARDLAGNLTKKDFNLTFAKLATGDSCIDNGACEGNICAQTTDGNYCTQSCDVNADTCPEDFACDGRLNACILTTGGCCSANGDATGSFLLALALGGLVLRRRRR
ncbi:MAG: hypothetical protein KF773_23820 [Deltaproteobacteria bacterium]|nr:hypothetical protein [Deltaproteobacteria bacterium]